MCGFWWQENLYEAGDRREGDEYDNDGNVPQIDEIEEEDEADPFGKWLSCLVKQFFNANCLF